MRELTYNNSRKSMLPKDYTKSANFFERNHALVTSIFASLGAFCIGTCIAWSSNVVNILPSDKFQLSFENMSQRQVSWIVAIFTLGAALSPLLVYKIWRFIGSKFFILMSCGFLLTSWILLALYQNVITILCARLLAGLATGCLHFIIPVYIQDIGSLDLRNTIDYIWHTFLAGGILFQYVLVYIGQMQIINYISGVIPLMLFCTFFFLPESPRYLCAKGQTNAAKEILRKFREIGDEVDHDVHIWSSKKLENYSFRYVLKDTSHLRRLLPTLGLIAFDQFIGVWAAFFYFTWIFRVTGGDYSPELTTIILSGIFLLSIAIVKPFGISFSDKKTLIWTGILMAICLLILGLFMHYRGSHHHDQILLNDYSYIPLACYGSFIFLYGLGLYRISWMYTRILVPKSRYFTVRALCTSFNWTLLIIYTRAYPGLIKTIGVGYVFWFMALACLAMTVFTIIFVPDLDNLKTKQVFDDDDTVHQESDPQI